VTLLDVGNVGCPLDPLGKSALLKWLTLGRRRLSPSCWGTGAE